MIWHIYHNILLFCEIDVTRNASLDGTGEDIQSTHLAWFRNAEFIILKCFVLGQGFAL